MSTPSPFAASSDRQGLGRGSWVALALVLTTLSFVLYGGGLGYKLVFDDIDMVVGNPVIQSVDLARIFKADTQGGFRPVGMLSLALEHALVGERPLLYRVTNVLLHAAVSALVLMLALDAGAGSGVAVLAALLFVLHPIHSEAVVQVVGRFELLAAILGLGALNLYRTRSGSRGRSCGALLLLLAAMLAKESAVGLIAVLPILDVARARAWGDRSHTWRVIRGSWPWYGGALAAAALVVALRVHAVGAVVPSGQTGFLSNPLVSADAGVRIWTALDVVARYARLLVFPVKLSADYSFASIVPHAFPNGIASWVGAALVAFGFLRFVFAWRSGDGFAVLALGMIGAPFAVASNLAFPIFTIMGERLVYLPSAGLCLLVSRAAVRCGEALSRAPSRRAFAVMVLSAALGLFVVRTVTRVSDWNSNWDLFRAALQVNPESAKMLAWVGRGYLERNQLEVARSLLTRSTELMPHWPDPRANLARTLIFMDDIDGAERELDLAERDLPRGDPWVQYHRGLVALRREQFAIAASHFRASWSPPWEIPARFNYAFAKLRSGDPLEAAFAYLDVFARHPEHRRVGGEMPHLLEALDIVAAGQAPGACADTVRWARAWSDALSSGATVATARLPMLIGCPGASAPP